MIFMRRMGKDSAMSRNVCPPCQQSVRTKPEICQQTVKLRATRVRPRIAQPSRKPLRLFATKARDPKLIPSFTTKVTTKAAKSAKEDEEDPMQIFTSFARFVVTSLLSF